MKLANIVVIGGPISAGKSSLVQKLPYPKVYELDSKDPILMLLWEATYKKDRVAPETIEYYFLKIREKRYASFAKKSQLHIFDRSIFETIIFARKNLSEKSFKYFYRLWLTDIKSLIKKYGKPKLYILLKINWQTFQDRFFKRSNKVETKYFQANKAFFKSHVNEYVKLMEIILKKFKVNYIILDTNNLSIEQVLEHVKTQILPFATEKTKTNKSVIEKV